MAPLAITLGPTALFLSRTPKVVEMMEELHDSKSNKEEEEGDEDRDAKENNDEDDTNWPDASAE